MNLVYTTVFVIQATALKNILALLFLPQGRSTGKRTAYFEIEAIHKHLGSSTKKIVCQSKKSSAICVNTSLSPASVDNSPRP